MALPSKKVFEVFVSKIPWTIAGSEFIQWFKLASVSSVVVGVRFVPLDNFTASRGTRAQTGQRESDMHPHLGWMWVTLLMLTQLHANEEDPPTDSLVTSVRSVCVRNVSVFCF